VRPCFVVVFGNKGAGKDTFANALASAFGRRGIAARRTSFAEPLKLAALHLLGIPLEVSNGPQEAKESTAFYGRSAREWLQWLGTDVGRKQIDADLWAIRACDVARDAVEPAVIVSDGRFRNELAVPRERLEGARRVYAVLVRRPSLPAPPWEAHASEREVYEMGLEQVAGRGDFDAVVVNDAGIEKLRTVADEIAATLGAGA
jgi:hypothetical protein